MSPHPAPAGSFPDECKQVLQALRGALTETLTAVGVDPARPQEVARRLGLHRNLTWKVSKIVTGRDAFASVPHVPGRPGMEILKAALRKAGAAARDVDRIESAMGAFDRLVAEHAGDRATLELVAGGFVPAQAETLVQARKLSFRGNSATWSVQARVSFSVHILAPNRDDPSRVDLAQVSGLVGFRRLRPDTSWVLFRRQGWDEQGKTYALDGAEAIDPDAKPNGLPALHEFCSPELPEFNVYHDGTEDQFELPPGPVGRLGELTFVYGDVVRAFGSQHASQVGEEAEMAASLGIPVELLHFDLLVHESLTWAHAPQCAIFSRMDGRPLHPKANRERCRLPVEDAVHELGRGLGTLPTPHVPRNGEMMSYVFERLGWDGDDFRGFRYELPFPPIPAIAMFTAPLLPPRD